MAENSILDCVSLKDIKLSLLFSYLCQHIIFTIHHRFEDIVEKEKESPVSRKIFKIDLNYSISHFITTVAIFIDQFFDLIYLSRPDHPLEIA